MSFSYDGGQRTHHGGGGGGRRDAEPQEWTPQELAEQAKNVAGNLTRAAAQVTAACESVTKATTPNAQAAAKDEAGRALEALRHAATAAAPRVGQASDPAAAAVLAAAPAMVRAAAAEVDALVTPAPDRIAAAPLESPGIRAFAAALAPDGQSGPQARQARFDRLTGIINHELRHGDLDPLAASLRTGGALAPLFSRLPDEVRSELQRQLVDVRPRLLGQLQEATPRPFDDARGAPPANSGAPAQVDVSAPVVDQAEAAPASAAATPAPDGQDPLHALARSAAAKLGVAPRLIGGEAGRAMTEAHGARGVAHNDTVAIHPDVDPETPEGRGIVVHEFVHHAQAQLPADQDAGRDAAEAEADHLATAAAHGGPLARPSHAITLTTPAADRDAKKSDAGTAPPAPPDLAPDVNYDALPGSLSVVVRASWLASADLAGRLRTLLLHLRERGILHWATPAALTAAAQATAAAQPGLASSSDKPTFTVHFTASVFNFTGLPPDVPAMVTGYAGALTVTAAMPGIDVEPGTVTALSLAQLTQLVDAMETFTGLEVRPEARAGLAKVRTEGFGGHGVLTFRFAEDALEQLFGKDAYQDWVDQHTGGKGKDKAKSVAAGLDFAGSVSGLMPFELAFVRAWLKEHLGVRDGVGGHLDRDVRDLITQIDQSPYRDQIIATLRQGTGTDGVSSISLRHAINAATFEAEAKQHQIALPTDHAHLDPVWNIPVPARIDQRAGQITDNETVPFFLQMDVPPGLMSQEQMDALRFRPFVTSVDWVFEKISGQRDAAPPPRAIAGLMHSISGGKHTMHQQYTGVAPQSLDVSFFLPPREQRATWRVTALVRHSHFEPTSLHTEVEVKTGDLLMHELRQEVVNDMGSVTGTDYDFDTGLLNNRMPTPGTDIGTVFRGELPEDWQPTSDGARDATREAEMKNLRAMIAHLREHNPGGDNAAAIAASERYLAQLQEADHAIEGEEADGWKAFEVKGTLMSDAPGVADGQLELYGAARPRSRVKQPRGNRDAVAEPKAKEDGVVVHLRDLSRRFDSDARMFTGEGDDFEQALAAAFVDLCQAYPPGKVFVLAQSPGDRGRDQTRQTVGFELRTGSRGKEIKAQVWDPAVNMVVNAAAMATMIFVPGSAAVIMPALMAYNTISTVDDLHTRWTEGRLKATDLEIGLAQIGLDLLPYLGRAQMIAGSRKALYVLRGIDIAGEAVVMTAAGLHQAHELQVNEVAAMAGLYEQLIALEQSSHPSDPRLAGLRAQFEARAKEVRKATVRAFTDMAAQRAFFVGAKHLVHGVNHLMAPLEAMRQLGGVVEVEHEPPRYDRARGRVIGDPKLLDEALLVRLMAEQQAHMHELGLEAAADLGVDPLKIEVVLDEDISVSIEPGRVRLGYSPKVTPEQARGMWKTQAKGGKGGRVPVPEDTDGGGRQPPRGGDGAAGAAGGGGDRRPALAAKIDEVGRAATVLAAGTHHHGGGDFAVEVPGGSKTPVRVTVGDDGAKTASVRFDSDHYILELPPHLSDAEVQVVLAGKLAEVAHTETRRANGQVEATTDALGAGGKGTAFSPKDFGMLAELRALRRQRLEAQVQQGPDAAKQVAAIDQRIRAHEKVMGFDDTDRGPALRQMAEVQVELEDDHLRRESERKRLDGMRGHSGFEFHTHWMGIVDAEVFRAKAAIAARGQDDGSWIPLVEAIAGMEHLKHGRASGEKAPDGPTPDGPAERKPTEKGPITKRAPAGDAYDIAEEAKRQVAELLEDADNKSPAVSAELHRKAESLAREAARKALAASPETDFNSAYEVRDELIKDTWAGKKPHVGKPDNLSADQKAANDAHANRGYDDYTKEALLALARDGVQYTEPSNSHGKMAKRFPPDRVAKAMDELIAAGQLEPGQIDLRFLTMTTTNHFGERRPGMPSLAVGESSEESWAYDRSQIQKQIMQRYVGGIDIAGQEFFWFDPDIGGARLRQLYTDLVGAATQRGERLVLRPHVGEGAVDTVNEKPYKRDDNRHREDGKLPLYDRAKHNIDAVLTALEALQSRGLLDPTKVDVRFGHATHATPEQAIRMKALGITAEVNLHSNVVTGVVDQTNGVDGQPRATEQYDEHALPTLLYYDTGVVLSTDAHAVMSTTMREEYTRARRLIDEILTGERRVKIRAADAGDRGTVRPDEPDSRWLAIHEMTADERQRFTHAYEKLYADATRQFEGRPGAGNAVVGAADTANTPRGAHATDLALEHGLVSRHGDRVFEGSPEQVDAAAKAYRNARYVVLEQRDPDGRLTVRVRSDRGDVEIELRHVPDSQPYRDMPEPGRQERSLDRDETRDAYNGKVVRILELDAQYEAEGVPLEERARRAYEYRHRAREWARQQQEHAGQGASLEVRDVTAHGNPDGPSFDDLLAKNLAKGMSRDEAYREIIKSAARTNGTYNDKYGKKRGQP